VPWRLAAAGRIVYDLPMRALNRLRAPALFCASLILAAACSSTDSKEDGEGSIGKVALRHPDVEAGADAGPADASVD